MRTLMQTCFECSDPSCALTVSLLRKPRLRKKREGLLDVATRCGNRCPTAFSPLMCKPAAARPMSFSTG